MKLEYLYRQIAGANNNHKVYFVEGSCGPKMAGESYYWTTPSGKTRVSHPNAYGYRTWYHHSTLAVNVGKAWKPLIPKGLRLETKGGTHLIRESDGMDLHFPAKFLLKKNFRGWARREMATNWKKRQIALKAKRESLNSLKNKAKLVFVTFADARNAGNCVEGIVNWAKNRLKIDREKTLVAKIPARLLLRLDPENQLVINSINVAAARHVVALQQLTNL